VSRHLYFASGSNQPVEIEGFARIGHAVGVSAAHLSPNGEAALHALAGRGVPVFVDSGAFSEVRFCDDGPPIVVKPMGLDAWRDVMALYERLGRTLGSQLHVVAPDRIGDQDATLSRLKRHRSELARLRALGVNIIVPIQRGPMRQAAFDRRCAHAIGFSDYVRGIPSKKKATSIEELEEFMSVARPARVHLLGMGLTNRQFPAFAAAATRYGATLTCDSNLLKASVGRNNGRGNHPAERFRGRRVYTRAQDLARDIIAAGLSEITEPRELAIPLAFAPIRNEADRWAIIERTLSRRRQQRRAAA
jgi:hypothetical protein